jgi:hypothetical protein
MRAALALGTAPAVCCIGLEAAPAQTDEALTMDLMERYGRDVQEEGENAT